MTSLPKAPLGDPVARVPFDPRYVFSAVRCDEAARALPGCTGGPVEARSHWDAIVFPADDPLLPVILAEYLAVGRQSAGVDPQRLREIEGVLTRLARDAAQAPLVPKPALPQALPVPEAHQQEKRKATQRTGRKKP